jgi:hypothetical protein
MDMSPCQLFVSGHGISAEHTHLSMAEVFTLIRKLPRNRPRLTDSPFLGTASAIISSSSCGRRKRPRNYNRILKQHVWLG